MAIWFSCLKIWMVVSMGGYISLPFFLLQKREISDKGGGVSVSGVMKRKGELVIIRDET